MSSEIQWIEPIRLLNARRLDLIIKRRLFLHFLDSNDPDAETLYLKHISLRAGAHYPLGTYLPAARYLFRSMRNRGFDARHPIPVNKDWVLLGGAHRTSCAIVLGFQIPIEKFDTDHAWPPWGREWFLEHGMADELPDLEQELDRLTVAPPRAVHA